jgi:metacaspase-1
MRKLIPPRKNKATPQIKTKGIVQDTVNLLEHRLQAVTVTPPIEKTSSNIVTRALLIGINYTGTTSELKGCVNDTRNVYKWLTKECGYDQKTIRLYTDESHVAADLKPTRANIENGIRWLTSGLDTTKKYRLFLHYSGHGSWTYDKNSDETDKRDESICPLDYATAGCIIDDDLQKLVVEPIAEMANVKITCLFDCCHSGTALDLRYDHEVAMSSLTPDLRTFTMLQNKAYKATKCEVILWSGCLDDQTSADAYIARASQGAMTWGFLSIIRKYQAINKPVTYKRALAELQILLNKSGYEQIPHFSSSKLILLSDTITF